MQFHFHRGLCDAAGYEGPLHSCSIYNDKAAGKKLGAMLAMGALTCQPDIDPAAIIDYFELLMARLDVQNAGRQCGW